MIFLNNLPICGCTHVLLPVFQLLKINCPGSSSRPTFALVYYIPSAFAHSRILLQWFSLLSPASNFPLFSFFFSIKTRSSISKPSYYLISLFIFIENNYLQLLPLVCLPLFLEPTGISLSPSPLLQNCSYQSRHILHMTKSSGHVLLSSHSYLDAVDHWETLHLEHFLH